MDFSKICPIFSLFKSYGTKSIKNGKNIFKNLLTFTIRCDIIFKRFRETVQMAD